MMFCAVVEPLLDLYLDDRLVPVQARWVEKHAARCPACAGKLAAGRRLKAALRGTGAPAMPDGFKARLLALAQAMPSAKALAEELPSPDLRPSAALAFGLAALAVFVSGSLLGPGLPSQACSDSGSSVCSFGGRDK